MATGPGQGNRSSSFESSEAVGDSPEQKAIRNCFVDLVEKVQPKTILPALYKERLVSKVKYKDLSKEAKSGCDTSCNGDIIFGLSDQQVHRFCKILLESDTAHQELGRKLHKELISCGCRPENLPVIPVPELPDSTESTDLLEAVSKFIGIEESPERQAIQRQLSSPGDPKQGLSKSLLISPGKSNSVSVKVTDLPKNVTQQELNGMLRYGMSTSKPSDICNVRVIQADVLSPNHAFIVCSSEEVAERVVSFLDGKELGDANVKISAKVQTPQSQKAVVCSESVKVHQLPKGLSKDRLVKCLGEELASQVEIHLKETPQECNYAWVNCPDRETASLVVKRLNGRQVEIQQGYSRIKHTIHAQPNRKEQNSLKVNHLPKRVTEDELKGVLAKTDPHVDVRILRVPDQPDNYGYINCSSEENAKKIKEQLDGLTIDGSRLSAKFQQGAVSHQRPGQGRSRHGSSSTSVKVNLPSTVTEVSFVRLGSKQRGFKTAKFIPSTPAPHGFLVFTSKEDAEIAHGNLTKLGYKVSLA